MCIFSKTRESLQLSFTKFKHTPRDIRNDAMCLTAQLGGEIHDNRLPLYILDSPTTPVHHVKWTQTQK